MYVHIYMYGTRSQDGRIAQGFRVTLAARRDCVASGCQQLRSHFNYHFHARAKRV